MAEKIKAVPCFSAPLLSWYQENKRDLPWRNTRDPYHIWLSEVMLQQTRAEAVKPYYDRFLSRVKTIFDLACTEEDALSKLWEGLGYYSRARNLKKAAEIITETYGGQLPSSYEALLQLPGIGSYTAGAIASIAFGLPHPAVDGNVLRVVSRLTGDMRNILDPGVKVSYEAWLLDYIPHDTPGDFNQALIELGATLCGPNIAPKCEACPLRDICHACLEGTTHLIPVREKKKPRRIEQKSLLLITDGTYALLHKREDKGLLAGMYEFPAMEGSPLPNEVYRFLESIGLFPVSILEAPPYRHIFTHVEWHLQPLFVKVEHFPPDRDLSVDFVLATIEDMEHIYPLPSAFGAAYRFLKSHMGGG